MCITTQPCHLFISLDSFGISTRGCLRDKLWLESIEIPSHQSMLNPSMYIDLPTKKLIYSKTVSHGKFGSIEVAHYEINGEHRDVYIKRPLYDLHSDEKDKSLLYEACVQKVVGESLSTIGFPTGTPKVLEIFKIYDDQICFAMEPIEGAYTLNLYLDITPLSQLSTVIIDCIFQLIAMMWHLNTIMGINHRDLKPSNFLIVKHPIPQIRHLRIEDKTIVISSNYSLTLIDFGFSCVGSTETQIVDLSLSNVYSQHDPCPKNGRDLYLFFGLMYIDYHNKLPSQLKQLFEDWLSVPNSSANLCNFMRTDKDHSKYWLYFIAGNEQITQFHCCPKRILRDLQTFLQT